jgi:enamine deaminase RidA (YjgF/YER057c/UK114 family)
MNSAFFRVGDTVRGSCFKTPEGAEEWFFTVHPGERTDFLRELDELSVAYAEALEAQGLSGNPAVFSRFYLSDIANQQEHLLRSKAYADVSRGAVSVIQQCPLNGGSVSLLAYHVRQGNASFPVSTFPLNGDPRQNGAVLTGNNYRLLWTANLFRGGDLDSRGQTADIFRTFSDLLRRHDMNVYDNAVRTWVYVRDIDNHYQGMVEARKAWFHHHGLTPKTKYIASTGIEGSCFEVNTLVSFDCLSIGGLRKEQFVRMEALDHLSPTIKYGVTFERGMRIRFGDRSHLYLSGTASIDRDGNVMHVADVRSQTERTLENIRALLAPHDATLRDLAYLIVYLRNFKDQHRVLEVMERELPPDLPVLMTVGPVCRPSWLVEFEGVAIIPDKTEYPVFC